MPQIPGASEIVRDFGLGLVEPAVMTPIIFGVASTGTQNALEFYNDPASLRDAHGEGPAVENACNVLDKGGGPIGFIRAAPSIAAANGSVTQTGSGPAITLSGTATVDSHLRVEIVFAGALGTAKFRYTLDGYTGDTEAERTYSETLLVPSGGTFALPGLGLTLTFASGTHLLGTFHVADVKCAAANATDLAGAFTAITNAPNTPWRFFVCVTSKGNGNSAAHATLAAALQAQLVALAAASMYRRGIMPSDAGEDAAATVVTSFASTVAARLLIAFGMVRRTTTKPFPGYAFPVTHAIDVIAPRAAASLPSTDLKRYKSGALEEVVKLFNDERTAPSSLDDNKISTLRTYLNKVGFYITQGRLKSQNGSDFKLWPHGLIMDIACETANSAMTNYIGQGVRIADDGSGAIDERDAVRIEDEVSAALIAQLLTPQNAEGFSGYVTKLRFTIDRAHNVLGTGTIIGNVGILPHGYIDYITTTLGFVSELPAAAAA